MDLFFFFISVLKTFSKMYSLATVLSLIHFKSLLGASLCLAHVITKFSTKVPGTMSIPLLGLNFSVIYRTVR